MAKKTQSADKDAEQTDRTAMAEALVALRHAAEASTPPHYRSAQWKQAIAKADEVINAHFNPPTTE